MEISSQKQVAIDNLVRETAGKQPVVAMIGSRYSSKSGKYTCYQQYLLENGHTIFVNLSKDPMTAHLSKEPNKAWMAKRARRDARAEKRAERKAAKKAKAAEARATREAKAAERKTAREAKKAAKVVKFDPKLPTLEAGVQSGWTEADERRIAELMETTGCNRKNAIQRMRREQKKAAE